jgi:CheY-like chemotaxis protein
MPTQRARRQVILVIEDYGDSREMLKLLLESLNYSVLTAANAQEALTLAARNNLDLIVTDLGLPEMDGITVVRHLRELNDRLRDVPIIMLTALDDAEHYDTALKAGCTEFLTKPLDFEKLKVMIERLLRERRDDNEDIPNGVRFRES